MMMSILARMNPAVCLSGSLDAVRVDDVRGNIAAARGDDGAATGPEKFGCLGSPSCYPRYQTDDAAEPLSAVVVALGLVVPDLLAAITPVPPATAFVDADARRTDALRALRDLTEAGREGNLVPLLRSRQWDVLGALSAALLATVGDAGKTTIDGTTAAAPRADEDRRLILESLVNLAAPRENQVAMALGDGGPGLLRALTAVLASSPDLPGADLSCLCLFRLTSPAAAARPVALYAPAADRGRRSPRTPPRARSALAAPGGRPPASPLSRPRASLPPRSRSDRGTGAWEGGSRAAERRALALGNPASLLRALERTLAGGAPCPRRGVVPAARGRAVRWACGVVRNVTRDPRDADAADGRGAGEEDAFARGGPGAGHDDAVGRGGPALDGAVEEVCALVAGTDIPRLLVRLVRDSPAPTARWTKDSLEDLALEGMCHLAAWPASREALRRAGAGRALEGVAGLPGVHGYRAQAIMCGLGALPLAFGTRVG